MILINVFSIIFIIYYQTYWISPLVSEDTFYSACNFSYNTLLSIFTYLHPDERFLERKEKSPQEVDFIIVGAGTAGCILANRLSENKNWSVLLLEEGGEEPLITSIPALVPVLTKFSRHYRTLSGENYCLENNGCLIYNGKVMGGTSSINGMMYARGNKNDFNTWAKLGNQEWGYEEVLPFFIRSENNKDEDIFKLNPKYHGTGGYQSVQRLPYKDPIATTLLQALREIGYNKTDVNGPNQIGTMQVQATSNNGLRSSTNDAFLRPIRTKRPNLIIRTNTRVVKIIFNEEKRANGVEFISLATGATEHVTARKEVILSAGAIESPKLLLLSGVGPSDDLEKHQINLVQNLSVGHNLQDHVTFTGIRFKLKEDVSLYNPDCETRQKHFKEYLEFQRGPFSSLGIMHAGTFLKTSSRENSTAPNIQFIFIPIFTTPDNCMYYTSFDQKVLLIHPKSTGYVKLNKSDPVWGEPLIDFNFFSNNTDFDELLEGNRLGLKMIDTKAVRESIFELDRTPLPGCKEYEFNTDKYWRCCIINYSASIYHQAGTCKMGPKNDSEAVVDARLRVYGVKGLRVADASIMPLIIGANPQATVMMIAEKASEMIKEDWS